MHDNIDCIKTKLPLKNFVYLVFGMYIEFLLEYMHESLFLICVVNYCFRHFFRCLKLLPSGKRVKG